MHQVLIGVDLPPPISTAVEDAWAGLGSANRWWTGVERLAIAGIARHATPRPLWDRLAPLTTMSSTVAAGEVLSPLAAGLAEVLAAAPSTLDRDTVHWCCRKLGDAAYAEMAAVVAQVVCIDQLAVSLGVDVPAFPVATPGEPRRERPEGMGDVGGHIPMEIEFRGPNVARSLSLAAEDHRRWRALVLSMYSRDGFLEMVWDDRALSRPQVEVLAARTSALNECFY